METKHFYLCNYLSSASCGVTDLKMQCQNIVMQCFVSVNDGKDGEIVEIQAEDDGTLLVENIETQFPNVYGLRYKPATKRRTIFFVWFGRGGCL